MTDARTTDRDYGVLLAATARLEAGQNALAATCKTIADGVATVGQRITDHELKDETRHGEFLGRLGILDHRVNDLAEADEITDITNVESLRARAREEREEKKRALDELADVRKTQRKLVVGVIGLLAGGGGIGALVAKLLGGE